MFLIVPKFFVDVFNIKEKGTKRFTISVTANSIMFNSCFMNVNVVIPSLKHTDVRKERRTDNTFLIFFIFYTF